MKKVLFIFGQLDDRDVEWLARVGEKQNVPKGSQLIRAGEEFDSVYIVLEGRLSVSAPGIGHEIAHLGSGDIVGEMSFVDAQPPTVTVTSAEDSSVLAVAKEDLADRLEDDMGFAARFYRALSLFLCSRLRGTTQMLGYGNQDDAEELLSSEDELNVEILDNVQIAGERFDRMLRQVLGDGI